MTDRPFDMPPQTKAGYEPIRGAWVLRRLMADPRLGIINVIHAAAIVGNLAGESGLTMIEERSGGGGWGWAQWTGSRRTDFEAFCVEHGWPVTGEEAAYEFLVLELTTTEKHALDQTKKTTTIASATYTFEAQFERPKSLADAPTRTRYALQAIDAMPLLEPETPVVVDPPPPPPPPPTLVDTRTQDLIAAIVTLMQTPEMAAALTTYRAWLGNPT